MLFHTANALSWFTCNALANEIRPQQNPGPQLLRRRSHELLLVRYQPGPADPANRGAIPLPRPQNPVGGV